MENTKVSQTKNTLQHFFNLETFKKASESMIAKNNETYQNSYLNWDRIKPIQTYTVEQIEHIIESGNLESQRILSQNYASINGFYKQILTYYATLLKYYGILIPNPAFGKSLQDNAIAKRYHNAIDFVDRMGLQKLCGHISFIVLRDGIYYGAIQTLNKKTFAVMDLPSNYCRSRFEDTYGNSIVEFNVRYFNSIPNQKDRDSALKVYPKVISSYYRKWSHNTKKSPWVFLPSDIGVSFELFDARPYFLNIIPATIQYDEAVHNELRKQLNEIKKIIVQQIPHLNDGTLLFEPDEVKSMHNATVDMLKYSNPDTSVLTSYGEVHTEKTSATDTTTKTTLDNMKQNIYSTAGVSSEIFAATGSSSIPYSIDYDIAFMMILANKISTFVTNIVNSQFSNGSINFKYNFLPISQHNSEKYIDSAFKLAGSGYSFLLPAIAQGFSQKDLVNIKSLENDVLKLTEILLPLASSYTQSGEQTNQANSKSGRPTLEPGTETTKTQQNRESKNKTGGTK